VVIHCRSEEQARQARDAIAKRLAECGGLQLHPEKTRIVCVPRAQEGEVVV
jgi:RNA-directed DNA polymerase